MEPARDAIHHHPELRIRSVAAVDDPKGFENEGVIHNLERGRDEGLAIVSHDVRYVSLRESVGLGLVQARFDDVIGWSTDALELEGIRRGAHFRSRIDET